MGDVQDLPSRPAQLELWQSLLSKNPDVKSVWIRYTPLHGGLLASMVPVGRFSKMVQEGHRYGVGGWLMTYLARDNILVPHPPFAPSFYQDLDLESAFIWSDMINQAPRVEIFATTVHKDGSPVSECSRTTLKCLESRLSKEYRSFILVGFEVEVIFLHRDDQDLAGSFETAVQRNHIYAGATPVMKSNMMAMIEDIVTKALQIGIEIDRYHAEMSSGQWEFTLAPETPVKAVDTLMQLREILTMTAHEHGFRATMHPQLFGEQMGSGLHAHISWNLPAVQGQSTDNKHDSQTESFFAGVLEHLPAIVGFAAPLDASFQRLDTLDFREVFWGWDNRCAPMRRVATNRFEIRPICATVNPYLVLASILAAGADGLSRNVELRAGPYQASVLELKESERDNLGIITRIPQNMEQAMECLRNDSSLIAHLGPSLVDGWVNHSLAYNQRLRKKSAIDQRKFLLETY